MSVKVFETVAADQQGISNAGWSLHYAQMSSGQFKGRLVEAELGGVQVYEEHMNTRIEQYYKAPNDALVFSFDMTDRALYLLDASTQNLWITPENYREIAVVIRQESLGTRHLHRTFEDLLLTPLKSPHGALFSTWLSTLLTRMTRAEGSESNHLGDQLIEDCLFVLEQSDPTRLSDSNLRVRDQRKIVQRVFEQVSAYPTENFSVAQLAETADTSFQQLRKAFNECVGMAPTAWLRTRRLNLARQDLLSAKTEDTNVAEVAMRYSFWHLGRFAETYRNLFLEYPSQTLARR
ncbi:MAG: helix-turn-helix domain-containing protein [Pseudomonas sp.]|jgi:AraC-like DNA-binding protein|uniref:helix-turn-helix domain-containing protein n=1 Tax=Pseudomonas sp. TaxID=306 RepID=UPI00238726C6|nr:helix-turn-helix domain-containing protein [Pseudomonas sp.]MDE1194781.1 helix-turn-helix domain-containing protein [Pseudomonas sp.]